MKLKTALSRWFVPLVALGLASALCSSASAAIVAWNVAGPADWFDPANWNPQALPTASDGVSINNGGTVTINTAGSTATVYDLHVGFSSGSFHNGSLVIGSSGSLSSAYAKISEGFGTPAFGSVTIEGGGSWDNHTGLIAVGFGSQATGELNMNGGTIQSGGISVAFSEPTSRGTVVMNGGTWNNNTTGQGSLAVGDGGVGTFTVNAGSIANYTTIIGKNNGTGTVSVNGGSVTNAGYLYVGGYEYFGNHYSGTGTLNLTAGTVTSYYAYLGNNGSTGTVNVSGGAWTNVDNITVGMTGTGILNLTKSGTLSITSSGSTKTITLGSAAGSQGTLKIGDNDNFTGALNLNTITGGSGTGTLIFNQANAYAVAVTLTGTLNLQQTGSGTTTLTKANTYSGGTTVAAGSLLVNSAGGTGSSAVTVKIGGRIGGTGSITGPLTIEGGGSLAPASSTLTANGGISLLDGSALVFRLGTVSDRVTDTGALSLGQNITLALSPVAGFGAGTYNLITFTGAMTDNSANFSGWTVSGLPNDYTAQFSMAGSALKVSFAAVPEPFTSAVLALGLTVCLAGGRQRRLLRAAPKGF